MNYFFASLIPPYMAESISSLTFSSIYLDPTATMVETKTKPPAYLRLVQSISLF